MQSEHCFIIGYTRILFDAIFRWWIHWNPNYHTQKRTYTHIFPCPKIEKNILSSHFIRLIFYFVLISILDMNVFLLFCCFMGIFFRFYFFVLFFYFFLSLSTYILIFAFVFEFLQAIFSLRIGHFAVLKLKYIFSRCLLLCAVLCCFTLNKLFNGMWLKNLFSVPVFFLSLRFRFTSIFDTHSSSNKVMYVCFLVELTFPFNN